MCGIFAYTGAREAPPLILEGLRRLEYRGYDSAGIAVQERGALGIARVVGGVEALATRVAKDGLQGHLGIGHTRWATHGKPCEANSHPHVSCNGDLAVVHNGILENHGALREALQANGHEFRSETDTECLAHLLEEAYRGDLEDAVRRTLAKAHGQWGIAVAHAAQPERIVVARQGSPLIVGSARGEAFAASDIPAMLQHTRDVVSLEDGMVATLAPGGLALTDLSGNALRVLPRRIPWNLQDAERGGFAHFMLKEIHDTPAALQAALLGRLNDIDRVLPLEGSLDAERFREARRIRVIACGSSYYAALTGKAVIEAWARVPVEVVVASEYRHGDTLHEPDALTLAISQSGETADTLHALRKARMQGDATLALTNVVGSSITREVDAAMMIQAGPEMSVAATKSFTLQVLALQLLGLHLGVLRGTLARDEAKRWADHIRALPRAVQRVLDETDALRAAGVVLARAPSSLFIGRQAGHALAMEGALKLKEISYLHAEGFAAGELKHGPLALVAKDTPVVALVPPDGSRTAMLGSLAEVGAREGHIIALADEKDTGVAKVAHHVLPVPSVPPQLFSIPAGVVLQLLAYHAAASLGRSIDRPRNLAKSVTVE